MLRPRRQQENNPDLQREEVGFGQYLFYQPGEKVPSHPELLFPVSKLWPCLNDSLLPRSGETADCKIISGVRSYGDVKNYLVIVTMEVGLKIYITVASNKFALKLEIYEMHKMKEASAF